MAHIKQVFIAGITVLLTLLSVAPSHAAPRPIGPTFFGVQDDHFWNPSGAYGTGRIWRTWCDVQPTANVNPRIGAARVFGPGFITNAKRTRITLLLGHPAPWVYGNHPNAKKKIHMWYCGAQRSAVAFPTVAKLRNPGMRAAYTNYVTGVIQAAKPYLAANPRNRIVLQAWNEPNLKSGGRVNTGIPGAAKTWGQAAASLREQERIIRSVARRMVPGRYELSSPSFYGKPGPLTKAYFAAQAKSRTIDSVSVNFYTVNVKSPNGSLKQWRSKAARAKSIVTRYPALRGLPIWITETNHNLINYSTSQANKRPPWSTPAVQRRLAEVTTLEAMRMGFAGIEWYMGALAQVAVNTWPGHPATVATARLNAALSGRRLIRCGTTWCSFTARPGSRAVTVTWSRSGSSGVTIR